MNKKSQAYNILEKEIVKSKNLNNEQKHNLFMDLNHLLRELQK